MVRRLDVPLPRQRHEIFAKIYPTDRRGELRSPALEIYIVDKATEGLLHLYLPQNTVTLARQRVVEVADPYKPLNEASKYITRDSQSAALR